MMKIKVGGVYKTRGGRVEITSKSTFDVAYPFRAAAETLTQIADALEEG